MHAYTLCTVTLKGLLKGLFYWESVLFSVMKAKGKVALEDGIWIGNQLRVQNGLQRVGTIPVLLPVAVANPPLGAA